MPTSSSTLARPLESRSSRPLESRSSRPRTATVGQAWKHKRNIMICIAYGAGCSQRFIAEVFDLPHSRVHAILDEYREKFSGK